MYRKIEDFLKAYEHLSGNTQKLFKQLTDSDMSQQVAEGHRQLGQIAWHIVVSVPEMMKLTGLPLSAIDEKAPPPDSAKQVQEAYKKVSEEFRQAVQTNWDDQALLIEDEMYGEKWSRGFTLTALVQHEIHHRGQMTVLLRQAGKKVPGMFGPSKEEWTAFGMEPPQY